MTPETRAILQEKRNRVALDRQKLMHARIDPREYLLDTDYHYLTSIVRFLFIRR